MLKQRDVDTLANLWPACLPGVQRTTKATLANLWPACLPGVQRTTKATLANLWPACLCAWRATHNQAHHESTPITVRQCASAVVLAPANPASVGAPVRQSVVLAPTSCLVPSWEHW